MNPKDPSQPPSYLPWREESYPLELSGKVTLCITYFGEEKIPRGISLKLWTFEVFIPLEKKQRRKQYKEGSKTN